MEKVFISYCSKDKKWVCDWLLPQLENNGIETHIDYRDFEIGIPSILNMERAVEKCAKTILVLTSNWLQGEWTGFEGYMLQTEDPIGMRGRILPLLLDDCKLPPRLKIFTYADFKDKNEWDFQIKRLISQIKRDFGEVKEPKIEYEPLADENIDIGRLPETGYKLFGRKKELKILNDAWESRDTNVLSFVAYGGVGKSTLINKWLEKMRWDNYRGAKKVFGWSFYSQGTSERVTSADKFISEALLWFGDKDPTKGSPWDKGQRLADLVRKEKTLVILDGLEPLQSGYDYEKGKIKDPALSILVTQLACNNSGLCVITTREKVAELGRFDKGVMQIDLDQISKEAGRALLRVGGVKGTDEELEVASEEFGNHALAINLLASYIHGIEGHHVFNAKEIPDLDIPVEKGRHPQRVIAAFEERFGEGPKIQLLNILGLFDRTVELEAIKAIYSPPPIDSLTDQLQDLSEGQWNELLEELRELKLLAPKSRHNPKIIDCHPLLREHFGEKLQKERPEAWKEAHGRLYEYYKGVPEKEYPDNLEEMEPLFAAVNHGCLAGRYQETFFDVYWKRICRGNEAFVNKQLGVFGANLAAVSSFFEEPWKKPASGLIEQAKAVLLNFAGYELRALGRLSEAAEPIEAATMMSVSQKNSKNVADTAGNLSELYLTLGEVKKAVDYGKQSVDYADRTNNWRAQRAHRTDLAEAINQAGKSQVAQELFKEAEEMQKRGQPEYPYLYSLQGFRFCDLLLSQGQYREVQERAKQALELANMHRLSLLWPAFDRLSLGKAYMIEAVAEGRGQKTDDGRQATDDRRREDGLKKAEDFLNNAVDGLRQAGQQQFIPLGILARAELNRYQRNWKKAWGDLEEAREIVERGEMNLFLADYYLEAARVCLAQRGKEKEAREHYEEGGRRVEEMGYHRRDPEVLLIKAELEIVEGKKEKAKETLSKAKKRIDEMGCHRWDIEVERLKDSLS